MYENKQHIKTNRTMYKDGHQPSATFHPQSLLLHKLRSKGQVLQGG